MRGFLLVAAVAASFCIAAGTAQAAVVDNESIDFTGFQVDIPCANGGAGDTVIFTGRLHVLITFTENGSHISGVSHFQPQDLSGTDSDGNVYHGVGITTDSFAGSLTNGQFVDTFVNNFYLVGTAGAPTYLVHETFHITFNANGDVTASVDHMRITCG
jgi:opacity protein-like surface antigen